MKRNYKKYFSFLAIFTLLVALFPINSYAERPSTFAQTAILMEQDTGRVLYDKKMHQKMRIASITKIMTALLAVESGKLDEMVTVSKNAAYTEGSSIYLKPGDKMKLEDLTYGLMLRSGNDAAVAIAEHVGGSLEGFVYLMNQKAEEIGMSNTYFSNPHGLDDHEKHFSTAYDMALLTQYAMQNETYKKISGTKKHRASREGGPDNIWGNKNRLLTSLYEYCTGGKTGYTKRARRTLVTTAEKDDMRLIAVTLNDGNDWNDHRNLYEWGFNTFEMVTLAEAGLIKGLKDPYYKNHVEVKHPFIYPLTEAEKVNVDIKIKLIKPDIKKWKRSGPPEIVGKMNFYLSGEKIGDRSIFYEAIQSTSSISISVGKDEKSAFFHLFIHVLTRALGVTENG
ncbi:D-alanyl-D-alanine carboxypeptidase [Lottiidibacillus patelloidae]|uniref:serine-type D-Ala-D-Ala carboxypeptidase n=1 Tax=Lottiidibacillus patelloidae TaxID=2670334 RepID=A0A263BUD3_9BACI|nr:D-alanyl-D-alanine carboxypeptidase [Lottiidibacillus patelloidae]